MTFFLTPPTHSFSVWSFKARTGLLEPSQFETFKKQTECLEFPSHYHFGSTGELQLSGLAFFIRPPSLTVVSFVLSDLCPDARQTAAEKMEKDEAGYLAAN